MATKAQTEANEKSEIKNFGTELEALCKKYSIKGVYIGTRNSTESFDDQEDKAMVAGFAVSQLEGVSKMEAMAIMEVYKQSQELMGKLALKIVSGMTTAEECDCEDCEPEKKEDQPEEK